MELLKEVEVESRNPRGEKGRHGGVTPELPSVYEMKIQEAQGEAVTGNLKES